MTESKQKATIMLDVLWGNLGGGQCEIAVYTKKERT